MTVYVSIGNSDDKLTQKEWASFVKDVDEEIRNRSYTVHGEWYSVPSAQWQNACWCFEPIPDSVDRLKNVLAFIAHENRQDSIAWVEGVTVFITAKESLE